MGKKNLTNRDKQAQETKKRIYDTAIQLILKKGFDNVTLEEISKEVGIAKGLFYHYYKSKADLIVESYKIVDDDFKKSLAELGRDTSPVDKILFTVSTMAKDARLYKADLLKQIYKGQLDSGTDFFINRKRPFYKTIRDSVAALQAKGVMKKNMNPAAYAHFIMTVARGVLYDWCLYRGKYNVEVAMRKYFQEIILPPIMKKTR
jgi:TetR/AcrR family transcriptional regulator, fatty acid metabolism regulator protein